MNITYITYLFIYMPSRHVVLSENICSQWGVRDTRIYEVSMALYPLAIVDNASMNMQAIIDSYVSDGTTHGTKQCLGDMDEDVLHSHA